MPTSCVTKADPDSGHCKEFLSSEFVLQYQKKKKRFFDSMDSICSQCLDMFAFLPPKVEVSYGAG